MISAILRIRFPLAPLAILALLAACSPNAPLKGPLTFVKNVQLPADTVAPSIDLLALDPRSSRLYVPHTSNSALDIVDVKGERLLGSVTGIPGVKAVTITSDPNIVFTSNTAATAAVVDVGAMKVVATIPLDAPADAIGYDPAHDLVVVALSNGRLSLIDRVNRKVTGKVDLPGKPELMAIDPKTGQIFIAIKDRDKVLSIDPVAQAITKTLTGCDIKSPVGIAFDPDQQRLFVANAVSHTANVVSVIDVLIEKCLGAIDIDHSPDQTAFNGHLHHLYVANAGSNNLSVIDTISLKPLGIIGTGKQAATVAADPSTDKVAVAVQRAGIIAIYHDP